MGDRAIQEIDTLTGPGCFQTREFCFPEKSGNEQSGSRHNQRGTEKLQNATPARPAVREIGSDPQIE